MTEEIGSQDYREITDEEKDQLFSHLTRTEVYLNGRILCRVPGYDGLMEATVQRYSEKARAAHLNSELDGYSKWHPIDEIEILDVLCMGRRLVMAGEHPEAKLK